jgi:DNA-binding CsgD family transcriptional regulator
MKGIPVALAARAFEGNLERLTNQERRILHHMLKANSSKEAAWQLGIAVSTAKNLRSRVLQKMMAENTASLLVIAALARRQRGSETESESEGGHAESAHQQQQ